jgi:DNA-binding transcriptional MerR regulator
MSEPELDGAEPDEPPNGAPDGRGRVRKGPNAFRTISEVADDLHIPQHVLRFWETKFPQVKPMKRGGGRRYYRPDDIALLRRVSDLLYIQGYTIKGVQRLLREHGGKLGDDIPPPGAEDAEADGDEMLLPLLGLEKIEPPPPRSRTREPAPPRSTAPHRPDNATEAELERLRRVLSQTLIELETLREMIEAA